MWLLGAAFSTGAQSDVPQDSEGSLWPPDIVSRKRILMPLPHRHAAGKQILQGTQRTLSQAKRDCAKGGEGRPSRAVTVARLPQFTG